MPDRKEATLEAWLCGHPEIEVVSRDRGGEYAAAVRKGAPQAQQVADKFHLLLNLREKLKELMARKQKLLPHVDTTTSKAIPDKARGALSARTPFPPASEVVERSKPFRHMSPHLRMASSGSAPTPPEEAPSQISRSNRYARYEAVRTLHQQAISEREIARRLKLLVNWLKVRTKVSVERPLFEPSAKKCWVQSSSSYTKDRTNFQRVAKKSHRSQSPSRLLREAFIPLIGSRFSASLSAATRGLLSCSLIRL